MAGMKTRSSSRAPSPRTAVSRAAVPRVAVVAALALGIASLLIGSDGVEAVPPSRATAVSAATGATYTPTWSCVGGQVRILAHTSGVDIEAQFRVVEDGVEPGSWLRRQLVNNTWFVLSTGGDNRNDNGKSFVAIEDRFKGTEAWTPVMTFDVPDCPDYSVGERSVFTGIAPERVLDTRAASALNHSGGKPGANAIVTIPASAFPDLPADATAVSVTVTGTEADAPGFLQAFPTGGAEPGSSSNVNLPFAGATVANLAVVPFAADGSISILTSGGAHILADVNGYFVAAPEAVAAGRLVTIDQIRMLDTRPVGTVGYSGGQPNGATVTVDLTAQDSGLPRGANAAVVNITATESTAPGFVQSAAGGELTPGASSFLNLTGPGQTVSGLSIVPLDADGKIDVYSSAGAHLIVDLVGWFTGPDATASTSGRFVPLPPERIHDNRVTSMVNYSQFSTIHPLGTYDGEVYLSGMNQVMGAVFVNGTVTDNAAPGFLTFGYFDRYHPTSNINVALAGGTVANAAIVEATYGFDFDLSTQAHVVIDLAGYFTK